jgi:hypothetical protein
MILTDLIRAGGKLVAGAFVSAKAYIPFRLVRVCPGAGFAMVEGHWSCRCC